VTARVRKPSTGCRYHSGAGTDRGGRRDRRRPGSLILLHKLRDERRAATVTVLNSPWLMLPSPLVSMLAKSFSSVCASCVAPLLALVLLVPFAPLVANSELK
jgi:hypothetical protein